jgi:plastin-1
LLQAFDKVVPGSVSWRRVSKPREGQELSRFKCVENTNYAVDLGKVARFSLPGIQGADIVDGNKTLTLGLVWQLMRKHVIGTLSSLNKAGRDVTDADMVRWGNDMVKKAGKTNTVQSFRDPKLQTALFYLDVLEGMKPGYVDYSLVLPGRTEDERKNNGGSPSGSVVSLACRS